MNYLRIILLCGSWLLSLGAARAQGKLSGVVLDSVTHEPLAFASVFLANTTLGATTTELGRFEFARVPAGTYSIVGSYVGYGLSKQNITVGRAAQEVTLELPPTGNALAEVVVKPEPNNPEQLRKFTDMFLGGSSFSERCHIGNPDQVRVFYDEDTHELTARAKEYLQIDNDALGYRLKYYGLQFDYSADDQSISYYGEPVFEEMTPRSEREAEQWAANRLTAYSGSFMHFLRSVYNNRLSEENFLVQQMRLVPNPAAVRAEKRRRALLARRPNGNFTRSEQDSIAAWDTLVPAFAKLYPAPLPIDSIRRVSPDGEHTYLRFRGELQVAYFGEAPDPRYPLPMSPLGPSRTPYPARRQVSRLRLQGGRRAEIQANGAPLNPLDVSTGEYWGFERIGDFLPFDYQPPATAAASPAASPAAGAGATAPPAAGPTPGPATAAPAQP